MKKRLLTVALLCGVISLSMAACGNKDVESVMAEEPSIIDEAGASFENESPIIPESIVTEAPENSESTVDKSGATMFPGDKESTSTPTPKPNTSSSSSTSSSSTSSSTSNSSTSTSKPSSESSTSSSSSSSTGTSQSTSTPAPETSSSSSSTPSTPDGHISVSQGSTGKTSFGTEYPILSEFNKVALDPNSTGWYSNDNVPDEYTEIAGAANRALGEAIGSLEASGVAITMDGTNNIISCGSAWVERQPSKGQYLFVYGCDFTALSDGGALSREVIKVMLGMAVTSTPVEVEKALFEDCFGDNTILDDWTTVGDCQVKFVYSNVEDMVFQYAIRPAK